MATWRRNAIVFGTVLALIGQSSLHADDVMAYQSGGTNLVPGSTLVAVHQVLEYQLVNGMPMLVPIYEDDVSDEVEQWMTEYMGIPFHYGWKVEVTDQGTGIEWVEFRQINPQPPPAYTILGRDYV